MKNQKLSCQNKHQTRLIHHVWKTSMGLIICLSYSIPLWACELCESQQPAMWKGITHGPGPSGKFDLIITWIAIVIVLITLYWSIKLLIRPKEGQANHIKNIVVDKHHGRPKNHQRISG